MNEQASATHGAHEDERWRETKRRRIRELEAALADAVATQFQGERGYAAYEQARSVLSHAVKRAA